jgi:hypothetical protein
MDVRTENLKDTELLNRLDLTPIDTSLIDAGDHHLLHDISLFNDSVPANRRELEDLSAARQRLANPDNWLNAESSKIIDRRCHTHCWGWNWLLELRQLLVERQAAFEKIETQLGARIGQLHEQRSALADIRRKELAREHRQYLKDDPSRGHAYVEGLVNASDDVSQADAQIAALNLAIEIAQSARRRVGTDLSAVRWRQIEVFKTLLN